MVYVRIPVNEKGQVVIPKVLRDSYGIVSGGEVMIGESEGKIFIEPAMTKAEFAKALEALPKWNMGKIDSDKDYAEELESR